MALFRLIGKIWQKVNRRSGRKKVYRITHEFQNDIHTRSVALLCSFCLVVSDLLFLCTHTRLPM